MAFDWKPPDNWHRITTVDAHTAGEPLRVITGGLPPIPGSTILAKRRYAMDNLDHIRTALMWEPRGHADMYGCIITEPVTENGTIGVLFLHNEGFSTMCGHGIIGLAKVALDTGLLEISDEEPVIWMDTPAGQVKAVANRRDGFVQEVSFENVPSYAYALDQVVEVEGFDEVRFDIGFGGAYYAICQAEDIGLGLSGQDFRQLIDAGVRIKKSIVNSMQITHPFDDELGFLYGVIFVGPAEDRGNHSRNVCVFADGEVDRCPTGTGISARAAIHYARGKLKRHQPFIVESIIGTTFKVEILTETKFGSFNAVVPKVTGTSHITGINQLLIDPDDPLKDGFILR